MTSTIGLVAEQIVVELETTSIESANDGVVDKWGVWPNAEVFINEMRILDTDMSTYQDWGMRLTIVIEGKSVEDVRLALEEVNALFIPLSSSLSTLNVILINAETSTAPAAKETSNDKFVATYEADMQVRYEY